MPHAPVRLVLDLGPRFTLHVLNVGLACCAVEFVAAQLGGGGGLRARELPLEGPRDVDVLVVSGTVTDKAAPDLVRLYEDLGRPHVVSFGACSNSGGPYWDSYSVTKGVDQLLPVDVYVPGCPPRPEALLTALQQLQDRFGAPAARRDADLTAPLVREPA